MGRGGPDRKGWQGRLLFLTATGIFKRAQQDIIVLALYGRRWGGISLFENPTADRGAVVFHSRARAGAGGCVMYFNLFRGVWEAGV